MLKEIVRKDFKTVDKNDEISKIFGYLYGEADFPIVMDGKKPWGIIDERRLIKSKLSGKEKIKRFVVGVPKIDASYSIRKVKDIMAKSGIDTIIVTSNKELLGYVTVIDVFKRIGIDKDAETLMKYVDGVNENQRVGDVINLMRKEKIVPVLEGKKFLGVIGIKNVLKIITTHEKITDYHQEKTSLLEAPVKGFMERGIKICKPWDKGEEILKIMEKQGYVIVCKDNEYMGMIQPVDLLI